LDQVTFITYVSSQGIERLHMIQLRRRDVCLAKGRHAQIDEDLFQWSIAKSTPRRWVVVLICCHDIPFFEARCGGRDQFDIWLGLGFWF
jgi:hypothetical protein